MHCNFIMIFSYQNCIQKMISILMIMSVLYQEYERSDGFSGPFMWKTKVRTLPLNQNEVFSLRSFLIKLINICNASHITQISALQGRVVYSDCNFDKKVGGTNGHWILGT